MDRVYVFMPQHKFSRTAEEGNTDIG